MVNASGEQMMMVPDLNTGVSAEQYASGVYSQ